MPSKRGDVCPHCKRKTKWFVIFTDDVEVCEECGMMGIVVSASSASSASSSSDVSGQRDSGRGEEPSPKRAKSTSRQWIHTSTEVQHYVSCILTHQRYVDKDALAGSVDVCGDDGKTVKERLTMPYGNQRVRVSVGSLEDRLLTATATCGASCFALVRMASTCRVLTTGSFQRCEPPQCLLKGARLVYPVFVGTDPVRRRPPQGHKRLKNHTDWINEAASLLVQSGLVDELVILVMPYRNGQMYWFREPAPEGDSTTNADIQRSIVHARPAAVSASNPSLYCQLLKLFEGFPKWDPRNGPARGKRSKTRLIFNTWHQRKPTKRTFPHLFEQQGESALDLSSAAADEPAVPEDAADSTGQGEGPATVHASGASGTADVDERSADCGDDYFDDTGADAGGFDTMHDEFDDAPARVPSPRSEARRMWTPPPGLERLYEYAFGSPPGLPSASRAADNVASSAPAADAGISSTGYEAICDDSGDDDDDEDTEDEDTDLLDELQQALDGKVVELQARFRHVDNTTGLVAVLANDQAVVLSHTRHEDRNRLVCFGCSGTTTCSHVESVTEQFNVVEMEITKPGKVVRAGACFSVLTEEDGKRPNLTLVQTIRGDRLRCSSTRCRAIPCKHVQAVLDAEGPNTYAVAQPKVAAPTWIEWWDDFWHVKTAQETFEAGLPPQFFAIGIGFFVEGSHAKLSEWQQRQVRGIGHQHTQTYAIVMFMPMRIPSARHRHIAADITRSSADHLGTLQEIFRKVTCQGPVWYYTHHRAWCGNDSGDLLASHGLWCVTPNVYVSVGAVWAFFKLMLTTTMRPTFTGFVKQLNAFYTIADANFARDTSSTRRLQVADFERAALAVVTAGARDAGLHTKPPCSHPDGTYEVVGFDGICMGPPLQNAANSVLLDRYDVDETRLTGSQLDRCPIPGQNMKELRDWVKEKSLTEQASGNVASSLRRMPRLNALVESLLNSCTEAPATDRGLFEKAVKILACKHSCQDIRKSLLNNPDDKIPKLKSKYPDTFVKLADYLDMRVQQAHESIMSQASNETGEASANESPGDTTIEEDYESQIDAVDDDEEDDSAVPVPNFAYDELTPADRGCVYRPHGPHRQLRGMPMYKRPGGKPPASSKTGCSGCNKFFIRKRKNTSLMICVCLTHYRIIGFHFTAAEGRKDVHNVLYRFFKEAPIRVVYDFACGCAEFCRNRELVFYLPTQFNHDKFHDQGHKCGSVFSLREEDWRSINTSFNEQFNSLVRSLEACLSRCSIVVGTALTDCIIIMYNRMSDEKAKQPAIRRRRRRYRPGRRGRRRRGTRRLGGDQNSL